MPFGSRKQERARKAEMEARMATGNYGARPVNPGAYSGVTGLAGYPGPANNGIVEVPYPDMYAAAAAGLVPVVAQPQMVDMQMAQQQMAQQQMAQQMAQQQMAQQQMAQQQMAQQQMAQQQMAQQQMAQQQMAQQQMYGPGVGYPAGPQGPQVIPIGPEGYNGPLPPGAMIVQLDDGKRGRRGKAPKQPKQPRQPRHGAVPPPLTLGEVRRIETAPIVVPPEPQLVQTPYGVMQMYVPPQPPVMSPTDRIDPIFGSASPTFPPQQSAFAPAYSVPAPAYNAPLALMPPSGSQSAEHYVQHLAHRGPGAAPPLTRRFYDESGVISSVQR